jgi:CHAT domain-containing protein/tetratricopeptide (TPR) repeat protein
VTTAAGVPSAADAARGLIDADRPVVVSAAWAGGGAVALAWGLKDECYAAWSSAPQRAVRAAEQLRMLADAAPAEAAPAAAAEVRAVADWAGGIAHLIGGRMADAAQALDAAASAFGALGQPAHAAATQVPRIMALSMLGRYDDAAACAEVARQAFLALGDTLGAGKVSLNLGALHERRGDYVQAARQSREAAVLFARVGDRERSIQADINLANALAAMGDLDESLRIYARARMRAGTHDFPVLQTLAGEAVALVELARGRYREALAGLESARRQYELLGMPQPLAVAERQLAHSYLELRLLPEAVALFDQVLARFERLDMPDEQAWALVQRGHAQALLGRAPQAAASFEQASTLFAAQGNGVGTATVALSRAELALAGGDACTATARARLAAQGFEAAGQGDGRLRADAVRAQALLLAGSVEQARALFGAVLAEAQAHGLLAVQVRSLTGLGQSALALDDEEGAHAALEAAVERFEDQRRALPGDDLRSAFLGDHLRPYQALLRIALARHARAPHDARAGAAVLGRLEQIRARALGDRVGGGAAGDAPPDAATQALRERLNWLYRRLQRLQDDGDDTVALGADVRRTEHELLEGVRRTRLAGVSTSAQAMDAAHAPPAPNDLAAFDVAALQALLCEGDALVAYGVQDDELFACIVSPHSVQVRRSLAAWPQVLDALRAARFQLETLRHGAGPVQTHLPMLAQRAQRRLQQLHTLVWAPMADALHDLRRVLVVPQGALAGLPFAALHDGAGWLGERLEIAQVPSAQMALRGLRRRPAPARRALAIGESSRLPHAAHEAQAVAALFADGEAFVGADANVATLQQRAPQADVIHLACHAQFRTDNPMFSALHLHDGALTVERAEALALGPAVVVLSACETGLGADDRVDERVGLVRAFLVAGASRVLASLWPVDDRITAEFMRVFYGALGRGAAPAAALREAQAQLRAQHPHPFFWAAFAAHGGW